MTWNDPPSSGEPAYTPSFPDPSSRYAGASTPGPAATPSSPSYYGAPTGGRPTNSKAVSSFVLVSVSPLLSCFGIITLIIGLVTANGALREIRAGGYTEPGDGLARVARALAIVFLIVIATITVIYGGFLLTLVVASNNAS